MHLLWENKMPVDPTIAYRRVRQLSGSGPDITPAKARAVATGLRRAAAAAPEVVAQVTHMHDLTDMVADTPVSVLARPGWAQAAAVSVAPLLDDVLDGGRFTNRLASEELAGALAFLAPRILGQYDPFALTALPGRGLPISGRLLLVAPNISQFATDWNLDIMDVQLFVSVHEFAHAFQFTAATWLKDVIIAKVHMAVESLDEGLSGDAFDELLATMAVLEGHAEHVMNAVPIARIPSRRRITAAIAARRANATGTMKHVNKLLGIDLKLEQYRAGERFVSSIIAAQGHEGFNQIWENPLHLPSAAELKDPQSWATRVLS